MSKAGLSVDLLAEFYISCLDKLTLPGVIDVLYQDYIDFCLARDVQPMGKASFVDVTGKFARKLLTIVSDEVAR